MKVMKNEDEIQEKINDLTKLDRILFKGIKYTKKPE